MKNKISLIKSPNIKNKNFKYHFMMFNIIFGWSFTKFDVSLCIAFLFKCDPICHLVINLVKWISYPSQSRVSFPSRERRTQKIWPFFDLDLMTSGHFHYTLSSQGADCNMDYYSAPSGSVKMDRNSIRAIRTWLSGRD